MDGDVLIAMMRCGGGGACFSTDPGGGQKQEESEAPGCLLEKGILFFPAGKIFEKYAQDLRWIREEL